MNYERGMQTDRGHHAVEAEVNAPLVEDAPRSRRKLFIILAVLIVGAVIAGFLLTRGEEETPFAADQADSTMPVVTVVSPGASTLQGIINATGTIAARREVPVGVVGEGGRVVAVRVEAGDWVQQGQVLAVIDRSVQAQQTSAQAAQIDVAQADADLAQANLDRALQLVERGFISQADIDRLTATRDAAVARVRVARAQLQERQARNAQLNIVAPSGGLVLARDVEVGQVVSPGSPALFTLARGGEMEVLTRLSEDDLALVSVGSTGVVTPVGDERTFTCSVWQKAPTIDEQTRQGTARCAMSYDPALRPGGFASVELGAQTSVAPRLPESAILSDDRGAYVYIVNAQNTIERRAVELGQISDEGIAIASGLSGSERVVLRAGGFLTEGEEVRAVTGEDGGRQTAAQGLSG